MTDGEIVLSWKAVAELLRRYEDDHAQTPEEEAAFRIVEGVLDESSGGPEPDGPDPYNLPAEDDAAFDAILAAGVFGVPDPDCRTCSGSGRIPLDAAVAGSPTRCCPDCPGYPA